MPRQQCSSCRLSPHCTGSLHRSHLAKHAGGRRGAKGRGVLPKRRRLLAEGGGGSGPKRAGLGGPKACRAQGSVRDSGERLPPHVDRRQLPPRIPVGSIAAPIDFSGAPMLCCRGREAHSLLSTANPLPSALLGWLQGGCTGCELQCMTPAYMSSWRREEGQPGTS